MIDGTRYRGQCLVLPSPVSRRTRWMRALLAALLVMAATNDFGSPELLAEASIDPYPFG